MKLHDVAILTSTTIACAGIAAAALFAAEDAMNRRPKELVTTPQEQYWAWITPDGIEAAHNISGSIGAERLTATETHFRKGTGSILHGKLGIRLAETPSPQDSTAMRGMCDYVTQTPSGRDSSTVTTAYKIREYLK